MDELKAQNHLTLHVACLWGLRGSFLLSHLLGLSKAAPITLSVLSWKGWSLGVQPWSCLLLLSPACPWTTFSRASPTSAPQVPLAQGGVIRSVKGRWSYSQRLLWSPEPPWPGWHCTALFLLQLPSLFSTDALGSETLCLPPDFAHICERKYHLRQRVLWKSQLRENRKESQSANFPFAEM